MKISPLVTEFYADRRTDAPKKFTVAGDIIYTEMVLSSEDSRGGINITRTHHSVTVQVHELSSPLQFLFQSFPAPINMARITLETNTETHSTSSRKLSFTFISF